MLQLYCLLRQPELECTKFHLLHRYLLHCIEKNTEYVTVSCHASLINRHPTLTDNSQPTQVVAKWALTLMTLVLLHHVRTMYFNPLHVKWYTTVGVTLWRITSCTCAWTPLDYKKKNLVWPVNEQLHWGKLLYHQKKSFRLGVNISSVFNLCRLWVLSESETQLRYSWRRCSTTYAGCGYKLGTVSWFHLVPSVGKTLIVVCQAESLHSPLYRYILLA